MTTARRRGAQIVAALGTTGLLVPACAPPAAPPTPTATAPRAVPAGAELVLDFDDSPGSGAVVTSPRNRGGAPSTVVVTTFDGGRVMAATGPDGLVARFPGVQASARPMAAVVVIVGGQIDALAPGTRGFSFGADVVLDEVSERPATDGSLEDGHGEDNGDNVLQRGLYVDDAQYKLQVDHREPSCRVAGADGIAFVRADVQIVPGRWYRLRCTRLGSELRIDVSVRDGAAWGEPTKWSTYQSTGEVSFEQTEGATGGVPISVGAKVDADGRLATSAADQFNGTMDNVYIDVQDADP